MISAANMLDDALDLHRANVRPRITERQNILLRKSNHETARGEAGEILIP